MRLFIKIQFFIEQKKTKSREIEDVLDRNEQQQLLSAYLWLLFDFYAATASRRLVICINLVYNKNEMREIPLYSQM